MSGTASPAFNAMVQEVMRSPVELHNFIKAINAGNAAYEMPCGLTVNGNFESTGPGLFENSAYVGAYNNGTNPDLAVFTHKDRTSTTDYGLGVRGPGGTYVNGGDDTTDQTGIYLSYGDSPRLRIPTSGDYIGDNTIRSEDGGWKCVSGIGAPLRMYDGDIQCMSSDGNGCMWAGECHTKLAKTTQHASTALSCGADHLAKYGSTGYENDNHWCSAGKRALTNKIPSSGWQCVPGVDVPLRFHDGDIQCFSRDGQGCAWGDCAANIANAKTYEDTALSCGHDHFVKHKSSGYEDDGHWCKIGKDTIVG